MSCLYHRLKLRVIVWERDYKSVGSTLCRQADNVDGPTIMGVCLLVTVPCRLRCVARSALVFARVCDNAFFFSLSSRSLFHLAMRWAVFYPTDAFPVCGVPFFCFLARLIERIDGITDFPGFHPCSWQVVEHLLQHGAQVDATDASGMTPLMYAVNGNHGGATGLLCDYGADVGVQGGVGS